MCEGIFNGTWPLMAKKSGNSVTTDHDICLIWQANVHFLIDASKSPGATN